MNHHTLRWWFSRAALLSLRNTMSGKIWFMDSADRSGWLDRTPPLDAPGRTAAEQAPAARHARSPGLLRWALIAIDLLLRHYYGIFEITDDPRCLLRVGISAADRDITLADGTRICQGARIGELHLWNEHLRDLYNESSSLSWARHVCDAAVYSLHLLALWLAADRSLDSIEAFFCESYIVALARILPYWGFEVELGTRERLGDFWNRLHLDILAIAYKPSALFKRHRLRCARLWLSRRVLLSRYGAVAASTERVEIQAPPGRRERAVTSH